MVVPQAMVAECKNIIRVVPAAAAKLCRFNVAETALFEPKYSVDVQGKGAVVYSSSSYMLLHEYLGRA